MGDNIGTDIIGRATYINSCTRRDRVYRNFINNNSLKKYMLQDLDKQYIAKNAKARTKVILQNHNTELQIKKNKLKNMLANEERIYSQELDQKEKNIRSQNLKEEKEKADLLELEKLKLEEEHLAKKKLELDMTKCKEIRAVIANRREKETRTVQQLQIKEKEKLKNFEKNIDSMWHGIMVDDANMRKKIEEDRSAEILQKKMQMRTFLDSQIQLRNELKKNHCLKEKEREFEMSMEAEKQLLTEKTNEKSKKKQSQIKLREELLTQMNITKETLEKAKEDVKALENSIILSSNSEYKIAERQKLQEKAMLRKEVDLFNKHLVTVKNHYKTREQTHQTLIVNAINEGNKNSNDNRTLLRRKQNEFMKEIISERDKQLDEKRKKIMEENEQKNIEIKNRVENEKKMMEIKKMEQELENNKKKIYKKILDDQINASLQRKKEEVNIMKEEEQRLDMERQQLKDKCLELLNKEFNTESLHPFAATIKKHTYSGLNWYSYIPETKYFKY